MEPLTPQSALSRKKRLGVSYPKLGEHVGVSHVTIQRVLKEEESGIAINRDDILERVNIALNEIEAKQRQTA